MLKLLTDFRDVWSLEKWSLLIVGMVAQVAPRAVQQRRICLICPIIGEMDKSSPPVQYSQDPQLKKSWTLVILIITEGSTSCWAKSRGRDWSVWWPGRTPPATRSKKGAVYYWLVGIDNSFHVRAQKQNEQIRESLISRKKLVQGVQASFILQRVTYL